MANTTYWRPFTAEELFEITESFPSTKGLLHDGWDPQKINALGAELWEDLSETMGMPPVRVIRFLDTMRYVLFLSDPQRKWEAGSFSAESRVLDMIWDEQHRVVYNKIQENLQQLHNDNLKSNVRLITFASRH